MSSWARHLFAAGAALVVLQAGAADRFPGIGRAATPAEVAAWDIDVRADFQGLPKGAGSVAQGQQVWESKCASCHGVFGESNEVFNPMVGGTTANDIRSGRVATLQRNDYPGRTTLMKLSTVSTLWDYIRRAMPWNAPKSLSTEEVYAVTAYVLHLGDILPADFVLSDRNIAEVQQRLPNRNGLQTQHGLWPGREFQPGGKPDVKARACMKDCAPEPKVASSLPDFARNAHGNLALQNRLVGPQRGADTTAPAGRSPVRLAAASASPAGASATAAAPAPAPAATTVTAAPAPPAGKATPTALLQQNTCTACHAPDRRIVGPSWREIAGRHGGQADYLAGKIRTGGTGVWGAIPMPAQTINADDARRIAQWLATGAAP